MMHPHVLLNLPSPARPTFCYSIGGQTPGKTRPWLYKNVPLPYRLDEG